eukprot:SAG25_NODE_801_length_5268_cov_3.548849_8_plen_365_part_00
MAGTQVGDCDVFLELEGIPPADLNVAAAFLPAPPPHPPPLTQGDCTAPAAAASAVVAPGWKDITEKAAENIVTRQRAPVRKGVTRPFPVFTPAREKVDGETWREYLLNVYAECLQEDPKPDPEHEGCSLNYGGARNGCMARVCVACRWMTEKNLKAHMGSTAHLHNVEVKRAWEEAEGERQKRRKVEKKEKQVLEVVTKRMKTEAGQLLFWAKPDSRVAERYKNKFEEEMLLPEHATATMLETRRVTFDDFKERQSPKQDKLEWKPDSGKYCEDSLEGWEGDRKNKADGGIPWMRNSILSETQPWGGITDKELEELKLDQGSKPEGWDEADFLKVIEKAKAKISKFWSEKAEEILKQATPATGQ